MTRSFSPSSVLEIRLFRQFAISVDGQPVEEHRWARRKPKQLVKTLALHPHHRLHREQLMELLWPELEPEAAANSLHKAIHFARHALEPELPTGAHSGFIHVQDQQVLLRATQRLWIDVDEFENRVVEAIERDAPTSYEAALSLYVGDVLTE